LVNKKKTPRLEATANIDCSSKFQIQMMMHYYHRKLKEKQSGMWDVGPNET
jgi:hypothetical protein